MHHALESGIAQLGWVQSMGQSQAEKGAASEEVGPTNSDSALLG
jgi:hypothetical protein